MAPGVYERGDEPYRADLVAQRRAAKPQVRTLLRDHRRVPGPAASAWNWASRTWPDQVALSAARCWILTQLTGWLAMLAVQIAAAEQQLQQAPSSMTDARIEEGAPPSPA